MLSPAQRWVLFHIADESFVNIPALPAEYVTVLDVNDFKVLVFFPPSAGVLKVQVIDAAIRVYETDA
jgi:hypothetical protein